MYNVGSQIETNARSLSIPLQKQELDIRYSDRMYIIEMTATRGESMLSTNK